MKNPKNILEVSSEKKRQFADRNVIERAVKSMLMSEDNMLIEKHQYKKMCNHLEDAINKGLMTESQVIINNEMIFNDEKTNHKDVEAKLAVYAGEGFYFGIGDDKIKFDDGFHYYFKLQFTKDEEKKFKDLDLPVIEGKENVKKFSKYLQNDCKFANFEEEIPIYKRGQLQ